MNPSARDLWIVLESLLMENLSLHKDGSNKEYANRLEYFWILRCNTI